MDSYFDGWVRPFYDRAESIPGLTSQDIAVYMALLAIARIAGGEAREFSCAIRTIESKSRVKRTSIYASLNRLRQFGLIESRASGGRSAAKYRLCPCGEHNSEHKREHNHEHNTGPLDDTDEDDTECTTRARTACRIWAEAFGERPAGATAEQIEFWALRWEPDILREAFNAAALAGASNRIGYVAAVLRDWDEQGIRTIKQWARAQVAFDDVRGTISNRRVL